VKKITALFSIFVTNSIFAQGIPDDRNINIIGVNPPTATNAVPDPGLKQQNEPACAMKPANPLQILCAFNDYRGVDDPSIGDAWEGYSYSINGGQTWFSDLLPGHPGDAASIGLSFAADPQVVAAPGLALISYIAADRGENADGGLFLQRMFEVTREAGAPWVPAFAPIEVSRGSADEFIDKPYMLLHPAPAGSGTVSVTSALKDGTTVTQQVPAARIFLAYTSFSGTVENADLMSKILIKVSDDYGQTWVTRELANSACQYTGKGHCKGKGKGHSKHKHKNNKHKSNGKGHFKHKHKDKGYSKSKDLIQSAALTASGDKVCAVWRRFEDDNNSDAIMVACSTDRGETFALPSELSAVPEFFPFDQGTTESTFRTNSYPAITSDGSQFYAFWSSRIDTASPFFARIVYSTSADGTTWSAPAMLESASNGHQFMPTAAAARGTIQLAWYDTRNNLFQADFIQDLKGEGAVADVDSSKIIRNFADIRSAQIIGGAATHSIQVSRYIEGSIKKDSNGVAIVEQLEYNFMNDRLFQKGTVPFAGDYPNVAAPAFRLEGQNWVSNLGPSASKVPVDFLVSWSDTRDVRGDVWNDLSTPTLYTPADRMPETDDPTSTAKNVRQKALNDQTDMLLAATPSNAAAKENKATAIDQGAIRADAEPDETDVYGICVPGTNADRSRNQNVYSSIIRPGVSIDSPSASKPTGAIQRANVVWVSNNESTEQTYALTIDNQPAGPVANNRASFLQVPVAPFPANDDGLLTEITVTIDPNSTVSRTVYITSSETTEPEISVSVSDGGEVVYGTIKLNGDILSPDIQNPDIQNPDIQNPDIQNAEVHNPDIQNVVITRVANPDIQNPDIQNPDIQNPDIQNPDIQNLNILNPDIQNPDIQNPDIQNISLDGANMENPDAANDTLTDADKANGYTDITFDVTNNGNTTTSFNLDAFINGETEGLKTQLIASRTHVTESSLDCVQGKQVQNQIIFNKLNPDLDIIAGNSDDGVFGDGSAYIAPGEIIYVTLRVWGDPILFDAGRAGVLVESQSCNSVDKPAGILDCDPPTAQTGGPVSTFDYDSEDWVIANDGGGWIATGGNPDGYLAGTDSGGATGSTVWYFTAPPKFLGNQSSYYGGELRYELQQSDAAAGIVNQPWVILRGAGITLVYDASVVPGTTWTPYAIPLETNAGWHLAVDGCWTMSIVAPNVCNFNGASPSEAQFMTVLSNLDTVLIRGEYSTTLDAGGLDNAKFVRPVTVLPLETLFTETEITGDTDILNDGVLIAANDIGRNPTAVTINGVNFGINQAGLGGSWALAVEDFSLDPFSYELDSLLSTLQFNTTLSPATLIVGGLTPGKPYRLQLLFSNDENLTANNIEVVIEGASWVLDDWQDNAINLSTEFTATDTSVIVILQAGPNYVQGSHPLEEPGRAILNGYAIHDISGL
jgi:hypothetical protein